MKCRVALWFVFEKVVFYQFLGSLLGMVASTLARTLGEAPHHGFLFQKILKTSCKILISSPPYVRYGVGGRTLYTVPQSIHFALNCEGQPLNLHLDHA